MLLLAGLVRKDKGKLVLTAVGKKEVASGKRLSFFRLIFWTYTLELNWAVNDGYEVAQAGQMGWAFVLWLLYTSEQAMPMQHFLDAYLRAFPILTTCFHPVEYYTAEQQMKDCAEVRIMSCFFKWFGLISFPKDDSNLKTRERLIEKTLLLERLFKLQDRDIPQKKAVMSEPSQSIH